MTVGEMGYLSGTVSHSIRAVTIIQHFHNDLYRRDDVPGLQAESFTRCCSDYCNICNINSGAGHQHNRPNSHDNEVTVSAQDTMTMMFLSQCVDHAPVQCVAQD